MEYIKLVDVSSPKAAKETINKLIETYDNFEGVVTGIAEEAKAIAEASDAKAVLAEINAATAFNTANEAKNTAGQAYDKSEAAEDSAELASAAALDSATKATESAQSATQSANSSAQSAASASSAANSAKISENAAVAAKNSAAAAESYAENAKTYIDTKIANLIGTAPEALDTLGEVAQAFKDNDNALAALYEVLGTKADRAELDAYASDAELSEFSARVLALLANKLEQADLADYAKLDDLPDVVIVPGGDD